MKKYDHKTIEKKWQEKWEKEGVYEADEKSTKPKSYVLDMFPYPSGDGLHVGHVEGYTATDIYARFKRMNGKGVLHPVGWDSFGLPAENFAIKTKIHPRVKTEESIENFTRQLKSIGVSYDWSRVFGTHRPDYYKWTQWFFLFLYKNGLSSRKKAKVNWCESCQTVLANEQVEGGLCERCKNEVVQKDLKQWFFHITKYADELVSGLDDVDWPESTKINQRNWIGKSEGSEINFPIAKKFHYVLIHGFKSSPEGAFFTWLREELEARGHTVEVPELPNADDPDVSEQVKTVLAETTFDENTIVLGHSLGSVVAAKAIEERGVEIYKLVTVAGFILGEDKERMKKYVKGKDFSCDYEKVGENIRSAVVLQDTEDPGVSMKMAEKLALALDGKLVKQEAKKPHFRKKEEPDVLRNALTQIDVFTTRADTIFGATYMVLAPEHALVDEFKKDITNLSEVQSYRDAAAKKTELERTTESKEKTGVKLEGVMATNPASGEEIPIYIADYVLSGYGTGAIMAVPAHDERDGAFAKEFKLPIRTVIRPPQLMDTIPNIEGIAGGFQEVRVEAERWTGEGTLVNSGDFSGMDSEVAREKITAFVGGEIKTTYRLRDWLVSRQRYWGAPIPIIYCEECGEVPVPEKDLPVTLPDDVDFVPTGESPLAGSKNFHDVKCPDCDAPARRESDTMDTFVDSSWYYLRFADPKNEEAFASSEQLKKWLPVDMYVGGAEHTVLHLMYARFFTKVLADHGYVDFREPFLKLRHPGMIMAEDGRKMSKSLGNIVNPDEVVGLYGADTLRLYEMFMGPINEAKPWNSQNIIGVRRFIEKVWRMSEKVKREAGENTKLEKELHKTIQKVTHDVEDFTFNTAISQMMICVNEMEKCSEISYEYWSMFLRLLAPFAPHVSEELWELLGEDFSVHRAPWPEYDQQKAKDEEIELAVQVNGKVRGTIHVMVGEKEGDVVALALEDPGVSKYAGKENIKKIIYKPGRILNFVVKE